VTTCPRTAAGGARRAWAGPAALALLAGLLALPACDEGDSPVPTAAAPTHAEAWTEPGSGAFHGRYAAREGLRECRDCHGPDLLGQGTAPGCHSCHEMPGGQPGGGGSAAHPADWVSPDAHGTAVIVGGGTACAACHGADFRGGTARVSCHRCHDGPGGHARGWVEPAAHGVAARGPAVIGCAACHGADFRGGWTAVSCYACHPGPTGRHGDGYAEPGQHGAEVVAASGVAACVACHGQDYEGGRSGVSCYLCHDGIGGHPVNWESASRHGDAVADGGGAACTECHGTDYQGGWAATSCYECHDGPGGHPPGWFHYTRHGRTASIGGPEACAPCHGGDYRGGWSAVSCYQCHVGPEAIHPLGWAEPAAHGSEAGRDDAASCRECHGEDLRGGAGAASCWQCHDGPDP
jgi:hypothetical protein